MTCNDTFYAGIGHITDAYKRVCTYNAELHADLEKARDDNAKLLELVTAQSRLTDAVYAYWAGKDRSDEQMGEVLAANNAVIKLADELEAKL